MIVVEYEFLKNIVSSRFVSQFRYYYKSSSRSIYRSEFADEKSFPVVGEPVEGMTFGWAINPDFVDESAVLFGPYKWDPIKKDWIKVDKKEGMSWLVGIKKKGGKKYED